jgi:hypothetical protein
LSHQISGPTLNDATVVPPQKLAGGYVGVIYVVMLQENKYVVASIRMIFVQVFMKIKKSKIS